MDEEKTTSLIEIERLPVIQEQLEAVRERWQQMAKDAAAMVCTADTVKDVKAIRAEMRKEFDAADKQRIAVKKQYMAPWDAVERTYKECIADAFKAADGSLKATIDSFESELKAEAEAELRDYFMELCEFERLDFLTFDQAMNLGGLKISLADAKSAGKKKLREGLATVVASVSAACNQIMDMDDDAEIMAEYKKCFDVGQAVATVQGRKRRIKAEQEAAEARRAERERDAAQVAKVDSFAAPQVEEAARPEPLYDVKFTCFGITRAQAHKIKEFLKTEGINYG